MMNSLEINSCDIRRVNKIKTGVEKKYYGIIITMLMAIVFASITGCDKQKLTATQFDVVSADGTITTVALDLSSSEPWPGRDRTAPYQLVKFGESIVKVPTGYIQELVDGGVEPDGFYRAPILWLTTAYPGFPNHQQYVEFNKSNPEKGFKTVFVSIILAPDFKLNRQEPDAKSRLEKSMFASEELRYIGVDKKHGLAKYKVWAREVNIYTHEYYVPVGANHPDGSAISFRCDIPRQGEISTWPVACSTGYALADGLAVTYNFPRRHLAHWKEIRQFVIDNVQIVK